MPSKKDTASVRLRKAIELSRPPRRPLSPETKALFKKLEKLLSPPSTLPSRDQSRDTPNLQALERGEFWARAGKANYCLVLRDEPRDDPLRKAFAEFGFDPTEPFYWRALLEHFAYAHFGPRELGKAGRRLEWTPERRFELSKRVVEIRRRNPRATNIQIAEELHRDFHISKDTLRLYIPDIGPPPRPKKPRREK